MAQATDLPTTSRFHNLSNPALADALGNADASLKGAEAECKALKDEIKRRGLLEAADPVFAGGLHNHGFAHGKDFAVGEIASHLICRPLCHFMPVAVSRSGPFNIFQHSLETAVNSRVAARTSDALFLKLSNTDSRAIS